MLKVTNPKRAAWHVNEPATNTVEAVDQLLANGSAPRETPSGYPASEDCDELS